MSTSEDDATTGVRPDQNVTVSMLQHAFDDFSTKMFERQNDQHSKMQLFIQDNTNKLLQSFTKVIDAKVEPLQNA
eukprot:2104401-Karenia_brevis.AAC.1